METRGKSNVEFRTEVYEILGRHESKFNQMNASFERLLTELQSQRVNPTSNPPTHEVNPFALETTHNPSNFQNLTTTSHSSLTTNLQLDRNHTQLKLSFPKFHGEDPHGWIYRSKQYFKFKSVVLITPH